MKNLFKNIMLYFSAFVPMYFLIVVKFIFGLVSNKIEQNWLTYLTLILFSVLIVLGILGLLWNIFWCKEKSEKIKIITFENLTDQHFMGYFSLFVLFALSFELTKISMFFVSLISIVFIGIVYINNQMFYINPLLNIMGYNFFEITYTQQNSTESQSAKLFSKGTLLENKVYKVKLKNKNFTFIEKTKK